MGGSKGDFKLRVAVVGHRHLARSVRHQLYRTGDLDDGLGGCRNLGRWGFRRGGFPRGRDSLVLDFLDADGGGAPAWWFNAPPFDKLRAGSTKDGDGDAGLDAVFRCGSTRHFEDFVPANHEWIGVPLAGLGRILRRGRGHAAGRGWRAPG